MSVFSKVGKAPVKYSNHNMSYRWTAACEFGKLYPVYLQDVVPGDVTRISNELVIRFMPMLAPILHEINAFVHYFYVPYRILWDGWETFITGGEDGLDDSVKPRWNFDNYSMDAKDQLWEFMGHHLRRNSSTGNWGEGIALDCFTQRGYNMIWNEWYRDTNLQDERSLHNNSLLYRAWRKDYFTSSRIDTQLGEEPAIPVVGYLQTMLSPAGDLLPVVGRNINSAYANAHVGAYVPGLVNGERGIKAAPVGGSSPTFVENESLGIRINNNVGNYSLRNYLENYVNLDAVGVNVNQLREIIQVQRWKERNMRAGARYVDFIKSRFPAYPRDDRLQRPEFIGGTRAPIIISEVLQTSEYGTDGQGNAAPTGRMSGHGISVSRQYACKYKSHEYGLIMGLMSIMPKPAYAQGVDRQWCYETKYDHYFPEFQHLGEQPVFNFELFDSTNAAINREIFGYQGRYNEMRHRRDITVGIMNTDLSHWHLARYFAVPPTLNGDFIQCNDVDVNRVFAVPSEPPMVVNFGNRVRMTRPIVGVPNPGLVDHI